MDAIFLPILTAMALAALATLARGLEASRRHVVCVRLEHELRRAAERERSVTNRAAR